MKGTHFTRQRPRLPAIGLLALPLLLASPLRGASIAWDTPGLIFADTNVSTTGSLLYAYTFGSSAVPSATVNGVTFASFAVPHNSSSTATVGSVSLAIDSPNLFYSNNTFAGSGLAPFTSLPTACQVLLQSGVSAFQADSMLTLTLGGLTIGQSYMVQFWTNDSGMLTNFTAGTTYTAGNAVTLDHNNTGASGGVGQWGMGSFTADASMQMITIRTSTPGSGFPAINAVQVRVVPEPSSALLLLLGAAFWLRRRPVAKSQAL